MPVILLNEPAPKPTVPPRGFSLLSLGFRPFYALAASSAIFLVPLWLLLLSGKFGIETAMPALFWHGHEMIFGFACAVIVGFLFTAAKNWTGLPTPTGHTLAILALLWIFGRIGMLLPYPVLATIVDLSFLPTAAIMIARVLFKASSRRNYFVVVILLTLGLANALNHLAAQAWITASPLLGLHLGIALIITLCTVIAGRIVPSFTANALQLKTWRHPKVDQIAIVSTATCLAVWALNGPESWLGVSALIAVVFQTIRCWGWRPFSTLRNPLLWILHISHAWIILALAIFAASSIGLISANIAIHLLTIGTISGLILGMITRTALGHTGRMLKSGKIELMAYTALQISLLARVIPSIFWSEAYYIGLYISGSAWVFCFILYLWKYLPILWHPRIDGQKG